MAEREPGTAGATGKMSYYTATSSEGRDHDEVVQQAEEYRNASTRAEATRVAQRNGVCYSELVRLPYFDIVRMCATDPMHTFLLGMVRKETELNLGNLSLADKQEFLRRIKSIRMPYDVGQLPTNVFDHNDGGLGGITADQWKLYICKTLSVQAMSDSQYRCIVKLSEIIATITSPVISQDQIVSWFRLLHHHHLLFQQLYGKWAVTVNYHMSLT